MPRCQNPEGTAFQNSRPGRGCLALLFGCIRHSEFGILVEGHSSCWRLLCACWALRGYTCPTSVLIPDSTIPSDIDAIIEFLERKEDHVRSESKESMPANVAAACLGGGKGMFVYRIAKGLSGAPKWTGDLAASRIATCQKELKEYRKRKESKDINSDNTGGLLTHLKNAQKFDPEIYSI